MKNTCDDGQDGIYFKCGGMETDLAGEVKVTVDGEGDAFTVVFDDSCECLVSNDVFTESEAIRIAKEIADGLTVLIEDWTGDDDDFYCNLVPEMIGIFESKVDADWA